MTGRLSVLTSHPNDQHFTDFELSEFEVCICFGCPGPRNPDIVEAESLDGENLSLSRLRPRDAFDFNNPGAKIVSGMDRCLRS